MKFNGFAFGINLALIDSVAYRSQTYLFDPQYKIIGQEDQLSVLLSKKAIIPKILHCVFLYHFKSVTVRKANDRGKPKSNLFCQFHLTYASAQPKIERI